VGERYKSRRSAAGGGPEWPASVVFFLLPGALQLLFDEAMQSAGQGEGQGEGDGLGQGQGYGGRKGDGQGQGQGEGEVVAEVQQQQQQQRIRLEKSIELFKRIILVYFKHAIAWQQQQQQLDLHIENLKGSSQGAVSLASNAAAMALSKGGAEGAQARSAATAKEGGGAGLLLVTEVQHVYLAADILMSRCCCCSFTEQAPNLSALVVQVLRGKLQGVSSAAMYWAAGAVQGLQSEQLREQYMQLMRERVVEEIRDVESAGRALQLMLEGKGASTTAAAVAAARGWGSAGAPAVVPLHGCSRAGVEAVAAACKEGPVGDGGSIESDHTAAVPPPAPPPPPPAAAATASVVCTLAGDVLNALFTISMKHDIGEAREVCEGPSLSTIMSCSADWCRVMRVTGALAQDEIPLQQHQLVRAVTAAVAAYDRKIAEGDLTMQELLDGLLALRHTNSSSSSGRCGSNHAFFELLHAMLWAMPATAPASTFEVLSQWQQQIQQLQQETELLQLFYSTMCATLFAAGDVGEWLVALGREAAELAGKTVACMKQRGYWGVELKEHVAVAKLLVPLSNSYTFKAAVELFTEQHEPWLSNQHKTTAGAAGGGGGGGGCGGNGGGGFACVLSGGIERRAAGGALDAGSAGEVKVNQVVRCSADLLEFFQGLWEPYFDLQIQQQLTVRKVRQLWGACPATAPAVQEEFKLARQLMGAGSTATAAATATATAATTATAAAATGSEIVYVFLQLAAFLVDAGGKSISEQLQDVVAIFKLQPRWGRWVEDVGGVQTL
jgi:hypothetical protein